MYLWLITATALIVAGVSLGAHSRAVRLQRIKLAHHIPRERGLCLYIHEKNVMNIYLQREYEPLTKDVEEHESTKKGGQVSAKLHGFGGETGREVEKQKVTRYIMEAGPITVISRVIGVLEEAGDIVHVDLRAKAFESTKGLDQALRKRSGEPSSLLGSARLTDLDSFTYVAVTGLFRVTGTTDTETTLSAPFGDAVDLTELTPRVIITCKTSPDFDEFPQVPFSARCYGRVLRWDATTRAITLDRVLAIFG